MSILTTIRKQDLHMPTMSGVKYQPQIYNKTSTPASFLGERQKVRGCAQSCCQQGEQVVRNSTICVSMNDGYFHFPNISLTL